MNLILKIPWLVQSKPLNPLPLGAAPGTLLVDSAAQTRQMGLVADGPDQLLTPASAAWIEVGWSPFRILAGLSERIRAVHVCSGSLGLTGELALAVQMRTAIARFVVTL